MPQSIAEAESIFAAETSHPSEKPLSKLIQWVQANDPSFGGKSEKDLFVHAYGHEEQAALAYAQALLTTGDDPCVKRFCIERQKRLARELMTQASVP